MTVAQYLTPKGTTFCVSAAILYSIVCVGSVIQAKGLQPDIAISSLTNAYVGLGLRSLLPALATPDLESIPFQQAQEILRTQCSPVE